MSKWLLAAGLVLGLITAFGVHNYVDGIAATQTSAPFLKLNPSVSLPVGATLEESMLETVNLPESFSSLSALAIPDTNESREWIYQRRVSKDISMGALLQYDDFLDDPNDRFATKIGEGMRAMTIPVGPVTAVGFFVEPGSYVDLVGTFEIVEKVGAGEVARGVEVRTVTKTILQDIKVLAVGQASTRGSYVRVAAEGYGTLTLEVSPHQAEKLIFATAQLSDALTVLLRNPAERGRASLPTVEWKDIN